MLFSSCAGNQGTPSGGANAAAGEQSRFTVDERPLRVFETASGREGGLHEKDPLVFRDSPQAVENQVHVFVNPARRFQEFMGIGAALTDASAEVFATLSPQTQDAFLRAYYDREEGIGYTLARIPIHSCDFSSASFTYVSDEDPLLSSFSIEADRAYRIPFIKRALAAAGGSLTTYASPWSPPAFMKSNQNMLQGGSLLPDWYESWALYFSKFIKSYEAEGIPIWGLTIQNEPMATQTWESCIYTAVEERDFLRDHLGPTLAAEGLGDRKIIVWDHNRDLLPDRVNTILEDPEAAKYVWGIGFHWYETWAGGEPMWDNLDRVQESYPDMKLIFTEGCADSFRPDRYHYWPNAERYGASIINDFNEGTVAWTDWNILLDERGGPNHVGNFCFAPVHADTRSGELIYTPSYWYIGHFSKFILPGARRVSSSASRSHLLTTAFLNPDGELVTVVMNQSDLDIEYSLYLGQKAVRQQIPAHSIQTLVY